MSGSPGWTLEPTTTWSNPFDFGELLARVRAMQRRYSALDSPRLRWEMLSSTRPAHETRVQLINGLSTPRAALRPRRTNCIRREWKALGPSCAAVEGDDEGFVSFERFDRCQTVLPCDRQRGGKSVGQTEIGPTDTGGCHPSRGSSGARIDEVRTALGGAGCGDGSEELDNASEMRRRPGSTMPTRNGSGVRASEARDVSGCVHHDTHHLTRGDLGQSALCRPPLHIPRRVDSSWHCPRIEPTARDVARGHSAPGLLSRRRGRPHS